MGIPRVLISYSHDSEHHRESVLQFAQQLRAWGIDAALDRSAVAAPAVLQELADELLAGAAV